MAGTKRKPQFELAGLGKRRATRSPSADANQIEGGNDSNTVVDQEQKTNNSDEEEDEHLDEEDDEDSESDDEFLDEFFSLGADVGTFHCTCGQCLGGFLSPRVVFALECQGEVNHDMLKDELDYIDGADWCEDREGMLKHLAPSVLSNLRRNKSMRRGFTDIFSHIAKTLQAKKLPITENILLIQRDVNEWSYSAQDFLERGGTVHAVVQACFDCAIDQDRNLGDGTHYESFKKIIDALPSCRNDRKLVLARRRCRFLETRPDEVNPRGEQRHSGTGVE